MVVTLEDLLKQYKNGNNGVYSASKTKSVTIDGSKYKILYIQGLKENELNNLSYDKDGKDLIISFGETKYTILKYFSNDQGSNTKSKLQYIRYDDADSDISIVDAGFISTNTENFSVEFKPNKSGVVSGTMFSDTISMKNALEAPLNKKNKGLTINGGKGNDDITGTMFNDTISGGVGINIYNYNFGAQSGQDIIKLTKGETLILNLKNGETVLDEKDVSYAKIGNDLIIYFVSQNNQLDIKNYFKTNATVQIGDDKLSDYMSTVDFKGLNMLGKGKIVGTQYNDIIQGSTGNDTITAKEGNDIIKTNGGKDTVVETGVYGHDTIDSRYNVNNVKVTVKVDSFDSNNISFNNDDLIYTTDENSDFTYSGFKTGDAADLWIQDKKKTYHIIDLSKSLDLSTNKNNNVIFLSGENSTYTGSKKGVNVVYSDGVNTFTYNGGNEAYIDDENTDDNYIATLTKSGTLFIDDKSGNDSLTINNKTSDLSLFYNINLSGADSDDLVIYNKNAISYKNLVKAYKNDSYTGAAVIDNYFSNGEIETIKYNYNNLSEEMDISGWRYYIETLVKDYLGEIKKKSVEDVLLNGTNSQKSSLASIFKNATYGNYQAIVSSSDKYSDIRLEESEITVRRQQIPVLNIYGKASDNNSGFLYSLVNFLSEDSDKSVNLLVTDDNGKLMTMNINAQKQISYILGNDNVVTFNSEEKYSDISFVNDENVLKIFGAGDKLLYTVKDFVSETDSQKIILNVLDDNKKSMSINLDSLMNKEYTLGNDNVVTFNSEEKYSDISFVNDENVLKIFGAGDKLLYTVKDFVSETDSQKIILNVLDDNKKSMTINLDSLMNKEYTLGNDNVVTFDSSEKYSDVSFVNNNGVLNIYGKDNTLLYTVNNFIGETDKIIINVLDDNKKSMTINLDSLMNKEYTLGNDNVVTFDSSEKYSDISFVNSDGTLKIYGANNSLLYTVNDFVSNTDSQKIILNVLDDNDESMVINLDSLMNKEYSIADNQITYNDNFSYDNVIKISDESSNTLVFTDKEYTDFYTKGELSGAYSAGDPLIQKYNNDLKIGDVTLSNIDGYNSEIQIVDKNGATKNIIIDSGVINGTFESEIIIGSNSADVINSNGNNDLIFMGDGDDTLNITSLEKGEATGKNTAEMIGIGGTHSISNDLDIPAISVYDSKGDDTYNTTLKEFGLYIEDYAGNDTLNIKYSDNNLMYFFDVVNPNHASENPTLYTDLMICDKTQFTSVGMNAISGMTSGQNIKSLMEDMQGTFGYAWIDDHFGNAQTIENINIIDAEEKVTALDIDSAIAETQAKIASWLAGEYKGMFNMFGVKGDYATAWDVLEGNSGSDKTALAMIYSKMM